MQNVLQTKPYILSQVTDQSKQVALQNSELYASLFVNSQWFDNPFLSYGKSLLDSETRLDKIDLEAFSPPVDVLKCVTE